MVASLTDEPNQWKLKHPGGHQPRKDHDAIDTGRPASGKPELAKVKTGGLI